MPKIGRVTKTKVGLQPERSIWFFGASDAADHWWVKILRDVGFPFAPKPSEASLGVVLQKDVNAVPDHLRGRTVVILGRNTISPQDFPALKGFRDVYTGIAERDPFVSYITHLYFNPTG